MGDQEAAPPSPVSRIADFAFDFGWSTATFAVAVDLLFLDHDHVHRLVGPWHVAAVERQHHRLVVACAVVTNVESDIHYTAVRALFITLRPMELLLAVDMPSSIVSLALPPSIEVLTVSIKTARAPIGASPPDVGRQCAGICSVPHARVLAAGALLHLTAKPPAFC
ncbi:hypothetical protein LZ30DRAFT_785950 [Colletotrichum cereale]|nr:hypothetical protein LZ30DRAFT_785950 [Colletotrichum cereale]